MYFSLDMFFESGRHVHLLKYKSIAIIINQKRYENDDAGRWRYLSRCNFVSKRHWQCSSEWAILRSRNDFQSTMAHGKCWRLLSFLLYDSISSYERGRKRKGDEGFIHCDASRGQILSEANINETALASWKDRTVIQNVYCNPISLVLYTVWRHFMLSPCMHHRKSIRISRRIN